MDPLTTELLPALRRYLALSQTRLAELLGVPRAALNRAERGVRPLPAAGRVVLAQLLAALPAATLAALAQQPAHAPPPTVAAEPVAPDPAPLLRQQRRLRRELHRLDAELAERQAAAERGAARLALLAAPTCPDWGPLGRLLALEVRQWTDGAATATRHLLQARRAGLCHELALLEAVALA